MPGQVSVPGRMSSNQIIGFGNYMPSSGGHKYRPEILLTSPWKPTRQ